jgi:hypothetical protein
VREPAANDREKFEAAHAGHAEIGDDDVGKSVFERIDGFEAVGGAEDLVIFGFEQSRCERTNILFVVDDENPVAEGRHSGSLD